RICAFLLDGILRREHEERSFERVTDASNRNLVLLHRLEERGLRARRRAIDLVGEDDVREHWARHEAYVPFPARGVVLAQPRSEDIGWHQVRRELDATELEADGVGQRLDEECFREAWHAAQQTMAAGEEAGEYFAPDALLADDRPANLGVETRNQFGRLLKWEDGDARSSVRCCDGHAQYYGAEGLAAAGLGC